MQASGAEEDTKVENGPVAKADEHWGKFYSMPPKWKKGDDAGDARDSPDARDGAPQSESGLSDENIGHKLASLLRYHLDEVDGCKPDEEGWVIVSEIVENAYEVGLGGCTAEDVVRVAETNMHATRGKRFEHDGAGRIKALYRHPPKDRSSAGGGYRDNRRGGDRSYRSSDRGRGYDGAGNSWNGPGWDDYNKWREGGWQDGDTWKDWKKEPGFSPSPDGPDADDVIVQESSWVAEKSNAWVDHTDVKASNSAVKTAAKKAAVVKVACEWEQWFTPDSMEMYFYNTQTEEVFFPGDAGDVEEKGWCRYLETEGEKKDKIYWWHEASSRSFYEEDTVGDEDE